ncbi:MAG: hypothetical protein AB1497_11455 [Bacillota bacterium]
MAQYAITIDEAVMQQLFARDNGLATSVKQAVNQVLEAQANAPSLSDADIEMPDK